MLVSLAWEVLVVLHLNKKIIFTAMVVALLIAVFSAPQTNAKARSAALSKHSAESEIAATLSKIEVLQTEVIEEENITKESEIHFSLKATGYNSLESQTDSTPHITATGAKTKFGVIAVSRDLLSEDIPYGSLVRIKDLGNYYNGRGAGRFQDILDEQGYFIVEDTMHQRKRQQIDVWFPRKSEALRWGIRQVELEVVRYGRNGPFLSKAVNTSNYAVD